MKQFFVLTFFLALLILDPVSCELPFSCYSCHSGQTGCGEDLDIRMQHWRSCNNARGFENFCVKVIEHVGGQTYVTRSCLDEILLNTRHRVDMPMVRRHGYCVNAISFESQRMMYNEDELAGEYKIYCFCNDFNACNSAHSYVPFTSGGVILACILSYFMQVFSF